MANDLFFFSKETYDEEGGIITIYFDNAATTSLDETILESYDAFVKEYYANAASVHTFGLRSAEFEEKARKQIASLLKWKEEEVIFTSGATESNNLAIKGVAFSYRSRGNHLITTKVEHASCLEAFRQLEQFGFEVTYLDVKSDGTIAYEDLENAIKENTILVSIMAVNNETGAIHDLTKIGKIIKKYPKIFFHSDITQAIGKIPLDLELVDLASMSLHKIHGFKGSGILLKRGFIELMPLLSGGGQEFGYRSGTNNVPFEVSAAKTIRLALLKQKENYQKVQKLRDLLWDGLKNIEGVTLNSTLNGSPYIVNFSVLKKASVVVEALSKKEIYVSTKSACSSKKSSLSYVLKAMGKGDKEAKNAIRVSFSDYSTSQEVELFLKALKEILNDIQ